MARKRKSYLRRTLGTVFAVALLSAHLAAQTRRPTTPFEVRAVFIYNFALWTEWPKEAFSDDKAPFVFGILGDDPFGRDIDILKGAKVKGRPLEVRYFSKVKDVKDCQVLFISSSEEKFTPEILKALENTSILTVGEMDRFLERNGILNFRAGRKPNYEVNSTAAERSKLKINSRLLATSTR